MRFVIIFNCNFTDSLNIIKILENTIAIKKQLEQQNEFFKQWKQKTAHQ